MWKYARVLSPTLSHRNGNKQIRYRKRRRVEDETKESRTENKKFKRPYKCSDYLNYLGVATPKRPYRCPGVPSREVATPKISRSII